MNQPTIVPFIIVIAYLWCRLDNSHRIKAINKTITIVVVLGVNGP